MSINPGKQGAGWEAVDRYVKSGMKLGMGTGSTTFYALERLGEKLAKGELKDILVVPTSVETHLECQRLGIPLTDLGDPKIRGVLDLAIDGADEIDPQGNLIKGGGGALLQEKVVAHSALKFVVVADDSKKVEHLGTGFPLPLEVLSFAWPRVQKALEDWGAELRLRQGTGKRGPVVTDNGNYLMDVLFHQPIDPPEMESRLSLIPGLLENGLFTGLNPIIILGDSQGKVWEE